VLRGFTVGVTSDRGRDDQAALFESLGATVVHGTVADADRSRLGPEERRPALRLAEGVISGRIHAVTFTRAESVRSLVAIVSDEGLDAPLREAVTRRGVVIGCAGHLCAAVAEGEGIATGRVVVPVEPGSAALVNCVADRLSALVVRAPAGSEEIVVSGTVATVDGCDVSLTPAEARLLSALAGRPDEVFSRDELLDVVWAGDAQDPSLVEVVVARLRRRLGEAGSAIASVNRDGYMLRTSA
jgi:Transcriptional regulatory protein, C terminal